MKKRFVQLILLFIALFLPFTVTSGLSSWSSGGGIPEVNDVSSNINTPVEMAPVCYSTTTSKYYPTVEGGLNNTNSGGTLYIIPGSNPTIKSNCQVKSGATLCLPYTFSVSGTTVSATYFASGTHGSSNILADSSTANVNTYRVTQMSIAAGVRLTLNSSSALNIGGVVAGPGQGLAGQTAGNYCEILMYPNSSIISNGGNINCYGYIKESAKNNGSGIEISNATLIVPFVIYDFKGGTVTVGICNRKDNLYCPFSIFDFPNVQVRTRINSTAFMKGYCQIYISANTTYYPTSESDRMLTIIGNSTANTMFTLTSGYIDIKYTPKTLGITSSFSASDTTKTQIDVHGNCSIGYISVTITVSASIISATKTINTSNYFLPISYRYAINVASGGTINIGKRVKFMTGSSLSVENGGNLNIDSEVILYDTFTDSQTVNGYPTISTPATLLNNGAVNVSSSGAIGGYSETSSTNGYINYNSNNITVNSPENDGTNPSGGQDALGGTASGYRNITVTGSLHVSDGSTAATKVNIGNNYYLGIQNPGSDPAYCWKIDNSARPTNLVSVSINPGSGTSGAGSSATYNLSAVLNPSNADDVASYSWAITAGSSYGSLSNISNGSAKLTTNANSSTDADNTVTVTLTVRTTGGDTFTATGSYICLRKEQSCLLPDTLVTMADGTQKAVKDIEQGDLVLVFNHETGKLDVAPITFNDHDEESLFTVLYLNFSNGKSVGVISEHGFFDLDTMRYEYIREDNYQEFIGHRFYTEEGDEVILTSVDVRVELTECYSPTSFYHFDYFVEGMLSMPGGITGLFNIFEFGEDLKYDEEAYNRDIETYGLFTYEDLAPLGVTEIMFEAYAGKYLKVALGKGILTEEYLEYLIARYGGFTEEP